MKKIYLLLLVALNTAFAQAQLSDWVNYNSLNWVREIIPDGDNGLWIATDGGIVRYDKSTGRSEILNTATAGLPDNNVLTVYADGEDLWFGTRLNGFSKMRNGKVVATYDHRSGLETDQFCVMVRRRGDRLIFGGLLGIHIFDGNVFRFITTPMGMITAFLAFRTVTEDKNGRLWFGGEDARGQEGLCYLNEYMELVPVPVADEINGMFFDDDNVLWMATGEQGLVKYDGTNAEYFNTTTSNIANQRLKCMARDTDGKLYFGTGIGIVTYDGENFGLIEITLPTNDYISSIYIDGDKKWLGTRKSGMMLLDGDTLVRCPLTELPISSNLMAPAAVCDDDGNVFIGASDCLLKHSESGWDRLFEGTPSVVYPCRVGDVVKRDNGNIVVAFNKSDTLIAEFISTDTTYIRMQNRNPQFYVNKLAIAPDQSIWMATNGGLYHRTGYTWERYTTSNSGLTSNEIISLHIDADGTVWCGAFKAGLFRFDGEYWTQYVHDDNNPYSLPTNNIADIERDARGRMWVAANDDTQPVIGLGAEMGRGIAYNENGRWINYNRGNSPLPSNTVLDIEFSPNGDMWLGTYGHVGLVLVSSDGEWTIFNTENSGIASDDVYRIAIDKKNGRLWLVHDYNIQAGISSAMYPGGAASIETIVFDIPVSPFIYDLQGRCLPSEPQHGIFIRGGKKILK